MVCGDVLGVGVVSGSISERKERIPLLFSSCFMMMDVWNFLVDAEVSIVSVGTFVS